MYVRIPTMPTAEAALPLRRVISRAASKMGWNEFQMATAMTHFLQELASEVCTGALVRIPGFGVFGGHSHDPKVKLAKGHASAAWKETHFVHCRPRFIPASSFVNEVLLCCPPDGARDTQLKTFRANHSVYGKPRMKTRRVFTAMDKMRETFAADAKKMRLECV